MTKYFVVNIYINIVVKIVCTQQIEDKPVCLSKTGEKCSLDYLFLAKYRFYNRPILGFYYLAGCVAVCTSFSFLIETRV